MAKTYGTVTTFTAGSVLTAAQLNVASTAVNNLVVPAACRLTRTVQTQSFANGSFTAVTFDSEAYDTDDMHSTSSNTSRITINTPGLYLFHCATGTISAARTDIAIDLKKNGTTVIRHNNLSATSQVVAPVLSVVWEALTPGDYFEMFVQPYSAASAAVTFSDGATGAMSFAATWIGRTS